MSNFIDFYVAICVYICYNKDSPAVRCQLDIKQRYK